jgi:hypothetical protein
LDEPEPDPPLARMFAGVLVVQLLVLIALWALGRHFAG